MESVMPSNYLILCHPLLFPPSIFTGIRVFSNELALHIRWPKYWSFSFSISPSKDYSGLQMIGKLALPWPESWPGLLVTPWALCLMPVPPSPTWTLAKPGTLSFSKCVSWVPPPEAPIQWVWVWAKNWYILSSQESTLVIANTLFQQHKRRLYTWTSPDGQHRNQIDYILCSQRWRRSIQSAKTRPGADCGSGHELLIAKLRLKLKKVGKTIRPFRYDLNQIPYDYTVEVRNRFKGLALIDRVPDELWTEVHDIVKDTGIKTIQWKKCKKKKKKWLSEEALQIAVKRREAKSRGEKERYKHLNAEFQRIARGEKKAFLRLQCKEIEENNRMGMTRDLFKKITDTKGVFHAKMGTIKDRNGMDLTEAEDIKKRWLEYTENCIEKS